MILFMILASLESCFAGPSISVFGVMIEFATDLEYLAFSGEAVFPGAHAR